MRLIIALVIDLWLLAFWPLRALRRALAAPRGAYVELVVDGAVVEVARRVPFWQRRNQPLALESLRKLCRVLTADDRVAGLMVRFRSFAGGSARATSLREILLAVRAAGKRVVVQLPHGGGTLATYVASAADEVLLGPETSLELTGFAVEASHVKTALDRVGLEAEVLAKGRFKSAGEILTLKSMSDAQREQLDAVLGTAWDTLVAALASGRKVDVARAEEWIQRGPWSARAALEAGIVDAVLYDDELAKRLDPKRPKGARLIPASAYLRRRVLRYRPLVRRPYLAVVDVIGPIVSEVPFTLMPVAAEEPVCKALGVAAEDPRALGLLLNVSSRGGSALASDRMLRSIRLVAEKKPVVAYMGDLAASGGYMGVVGGHSIVAQPTTLTGSIGVIAARFVARGLMARLGVDVEVIKRGARADMMSPARRLEPDERRDLEAHIDEIYASFLGAVARGRNRPVQDIEPLAGGRVWSGRDAHAHGLVDQLGGFDAALGELRRRVGPVAERLEPVVVGPAHLSPPSPLLRLLRGAERALGVSPLVDLATIALGEPRERVWLWCEAAELRD